MSDPLSNSLPNILSKTPSNTLSRIQYPFSDCFLRLLLYLFPCSRLPILGFKQLHPWSESAGAASDNPFSFARACTARPWCRQNITTNDHYLVRPHSLKDYTNNIATNTGCVFVGTGILSNFIEHDSDVLKCEPQIP